MIGTESGVFAAGIGALMFGVLYALAVFIPLHGKHAGYTSWLVAIGSGAAIFFFGLAYGFDWAVRVLAFFMLAGVPMMLGEAIKSKVDELREVKRKAAEIEKVLNEAAQDA